MSTPNGRLTACHCVLFCLFIITPATAPATTLIVPTEHGTIQAGLNAASPGDTVLVEYGTYYEHDIQLASGVTLRGEGDPGSTIIDAQQQGGVLVADGLDQDVTVADLTITGGLAPLGGGLYAGGSVAHVERCVVVGNEADFDESGTGHGGGIRCDGASTLTVTDSRIESNHASYSGGGIHCDDGSMATILRCVIRGNSGELAAATAIVSAGGSDVEIEQCVIVEHAGDPRFGVLGNHFGARLVVRHSIVAFNSMGVVNCSLEGSTLIECCDVYANGSSQFWPDCVADQQYANGNFSADPLFCDLSGGDLTLDTLSPCLPDNSPTGCERIVGAFGRGCGAEPPLIVIQPEPSFLEAPWTLEGPAGYSNAGTGSTTLSGLEPGTYRLDWGIVEGWIQPVPRFAVIQLESESIATISGRYSRSIWRVPQDAATIGEAVELAIAGNTIVVTDGVYDEHSLALRSGVTLRSESGDPGTTIIDGHGSNILLLVDADTTTVVQGLTLRGGNAAVRLDRSSPQIRDCAIVSGDQAAFIVGNHGDPGPGGSSPPVLFDGCEISDHRNAFDSPGIEAAEAKLRIVDCLFRENRVTEPNPVYGGAISCTGASTLEVESSVFIGNRAYQGGGAIYVPSGEVAVRSSTFGSNRSRYGGAILCHGGVLEDCEFEGNRAYAGCCYDEGGGAGGAILTTADAALDIEKCLFVANEAASTTGREGEFLPGSGGAIRGGDGVSVSSSTFYRNTAHSGGSVRGLGRIDHSIFSSDSGVAPIEGSATIECVDVFQLPPATQPSAPIGKGVFSAPPLFCDPLNGDFELHADSPCLPKNSPIGCTEIVGAFGEGCPATIILLDAFSIVQQRGSVVCEWETSDPSRAFRLVASTESRERHVDVEDLTGGRFRATDPIAHLAAGTSIRYTLEAFVDDAWISAHEQRLILESVAYRTEFRGVHPNPFAGETVVHLSLARTMRVRLEAFDIRGRRVSVIHDDELGSGPHTLSWHGTDSRGKRLAAGIYFLRLQTPDGVRSRKILKMN